MTSTISLCKSVYYEIKLLNLVRKRWKMLMESLVSSKSENQIEQEYEILDTHSKMYGFDAIISIPIGKNLLEFRALLPSISTFFQGRIIAEYSEDKASIYLRCHRYGFGIDEKDDVKFKWYMLFGDKKFRNDYGETFTLKNSKIINHPVKKDDENKPILLGYRYKVTIPEGLTYELLENNIVTLNKTFGVCDLRFDDDTNATTIEIINTKLPDDEKYAPVKVKPYELYVGMTHSYRPILLNFKIDPNCIWGGKSGSGKTLSMIMGLLNLCIYHDRDKVRLYIAMLSDKQDLRVFKNINQCDYYADTLIKVESMLKYLSKECTRRNRLFEKSDEMGSITNLFEYNDAFPQSKLPLIYICLDEIASLSENGTETSEDDVDSKKRCSALLWKLAREGRSAGIYSCMATQRGDVKNLDANIKANLGNQIGFFFSNMPSAQTILGNPELATMATKIKKQREFIALADEVYHGKTLFLSLKDVIEKLQPYRVINKQHLNLTVAGDLEIEVVKRNLEKMQKNDNKPMENDNKSSIFLNNCKITKETIKMVESIEDAKKEENTKEANEIATELEHHGNGEISKMTKWNNGKR